MKTIPVIVSAFTILVFLFLPVTATATDLTLNNARAKACFSPEGGCTAAIMDEAGKAKTEILVQMFSFTSGPIRDSLLKAQRRGVTVAIILDQGEQKNQRYKTANILSRGGVRVFLDDLHSHAHNKVMIVDRETVVTGSFNYTYAAEDKNAENILIIRSTDLSKFYIDDWFRHKEHSRRH